MRRALLCALALLVAAPAVAATAPGRQLVLRVTQVDAAGAALATPRETVCPADGCQMAAELRLASGALSFNTVVTFVAGGAYVALAALPAGAARIREFSQARPEPIFLRSKTGGSTVLGLVVDRTSAASSDTGEPDAYLRLELAPPPA